MVFWQPQVDKYTFSWVYPQKIPLTIHKQEFSKNMLPPSLRSQVFSIYTQIQRCRQAYMQRNLAYMCVPTHIQSETEVICAQTQSYTGLQSVPRKSHMCLHNHTCISRLHTHTHSSEATGPSLPVACTMHSSGVRGCTFGRRELAGRTLAGTDWDPSTLWPPVGMSSWRPTHFHLCSGPAGKQGPLTKPPWSVIGYKGGHMCPQEGPPNSWSSKLSLWLFLLKLYPDSLSPPIVSLPPVDPAVSSKWQERASPRLG